MYNTTHLWEHSAEVPQRPESPRAPASCFAEAQGRGPACRLRRRRGARGKQKEPDCIVTEIARKVQRRKARRARRCDGSVGTCGQQRNGDIFEAKTARRQEGREAGSGARIRVSAGRDKRERTRVTPLRARKQKRRHSIRVHDICVSASRKQHSDNRNVATCARLKEQRVAATAAALRNSDRS